MNPFQSITLPSTVTDIGCSAFSHCKSLREVVLNEGQKKIGRWAFNECRSLQTITFPSTVTDIGGYSFYECSSLKEVIFNEGLVRIGKGSFNECTSLESITIPSSVNDIGGAAFWKCIRLREVVFSGGLPNVEPTTFCRVDALERITFPNLSSRLEAIIQDGRVELQNKIQQFINQNEMIEWERGGTIFITGETTRIWLGWSLKRRDGWCLLKQCIDRIVNWIEYYEMKEGTTLFELALWKARIDQVDETTSLDREACRVNVPGPVKDVILQYLL